MRGLPVDVESADKILSYIEGYAEEMTRRVPEISDGAVQKVTQVKRIREWLATKGIVTPLIDSVPNLSGLGGFDL